MSAFDDVLAGAAAGVVVTAVFHPLEVAELQLQAQQVRGATVRGALRAVLQAGGTSALFTALRPGLACAAVGFGVYFGCYGCIKRSLTDSRCGTVLPPLATNLLSAAAAGCVTSIVNNPLMVIKTQMILGLPAGLRNPAVAALPTGSKAVAKQQQHHSAPSVSQTIRSVYKTSGVRGFYAGLAPSLAGNAEAGFHMMLYELLKASIAQGSGAAMSSSSSYSALTAGSGVAKLISASLTYPLAPVRTMIMNAKEGATKVGTLACSKQLYASQGLIGFYRGLPASLAKQVVPMAFMFGLLELIRDGLATARYLIQGEALYC